MHSLPYSASADRNKEAIGDALANHFQAALSVLEVGSGTGQHAVYLCHRFTQLQWQMTEQEQYLEPLREVVAHAGLANLVNPVALTVNPSGVDDAVSASKYTFAFSANTAHIMSIDQVEAMFKVVSRHLFPQGLFALYGPFKENGQHNSEGNRKFDATLRTQNPHMGIRALEDLQLFAVSCGMRLHSQIAMPANNRILLWEKGAV